MHPDVESLPVEIHPSPSLVRYYLVISLALGPFFFLSFIPRYLRYRTLRYRVDGDGISMAWGILSQREIVLNYARIQDIHLTSNVVERWLGLAKIRIQTASGSAEAEMVLEGLDAPEEMRDFLYSRMRGGGDDRDLRSDSEPSRRKVTAEGKGTGATAPETREPAGDDSESDDLAAAFAEVTSEIRALRRELAARDLDSGDVG